MTNIKVRIEGMSDLIQGNCESMGAKPPKSPEQIPAWLELQVYRGEDGFIYHPSQAIRNSFLQGASMLKVGKKNAKTVLMGITRIIPEILIPLYRAEGEQINDYGKLTCSVVNNNTRPPSRLIAHRPLIKAPWYMDFVLEVNDDYYPVNDTSIKQLKDIFNQAGMMVGIGVWRPQKTGLYGRYKVTSFEKI